MAQTNRILIIDDNYEVALFMRSTLEIVLPDYQIKSVPSAEEGMLEMDRGVSLLIADLKLPGMDGVDFVRLFRRRYTYTPIIVVTGEDRPEWHKHARAVGLNGFLRKPLKVDDFIQVVRQALGEDIPIDEKMVPPPQLVAGLGNLRSESGAEFVMLVDLKGKCLASDGMVRKLNTDQIASMLTADLDTSFELARMLRARQPFTIHYQAGQRYDLYTANAGPDHLLVLFFAAQRGPSKLGTIWGYAHKAVKELLPLLSPSDEPVSKPSKQPEPYKDVEQLPGKSPIIKVESQLVPKNATETGKKNELYEPHIQSKAKPIEPAEAPEPELIPKAEPSEPVKMTESLSVKALESELAKEAIQLEKIELSPHEVDAFWDRVITGEDADNVGTEGIKLQQALDQGLIPPDFRPE